MTRGGATVGVVLACLAAGPVAADEPGTINTHATAHRRLPNTVADVAVGLEAHARTLQALTASVAASTDRLMAYLRTQKVDRLATDRVAITPETQSVRGGPDRITGFGATLRVTFRVPADRLDGLLGGALANGGNTIESTSLTPRETEIDEARRALAAEAVRIALAQAGAVAEAAGRHLGTVRRIEVDPGSGYAPLGLARPAPPMMRAMAASEPAPIATSAGEAELESTVSVTVNLLEP